MMVDLHCHILPGIDDGAQNLTDSILMAKQAVEDGIATIVATPHYHNNVYENTKPTIN
jgi:protein-tyrosine phosphatase